MALVLRSGALDSLMGLKAAHGDEGRQNLQHRKGYPTTKVWRACWHTGVFGRENWFSFPRRPSGCPILVTLHGIYVARDCDHLPVVLQSSENSLVASYTTSSASFLPYQTCAVAS